MTTESNVGARIFLIGKDALGLAEIQAAVAKLNAEIAAGATSSKAAAAGMDEEAAATGRLNAVSDLYKANLAAVNVEQDALARVGKAAFFGMTAAGLCGVTKASNGRRTTRPPWCSCGPRQA